MNTAVTSPPTTIATPATGSAGAGLRRQFNRAGSAIWRALAVSRRARAHSWLLDLANQCEPPQPALAMELRTAARQGPMA